MFSFVQMGRSRFGDYLGGKTALFYFFREAELLPRKLIKWLSCSQGSRGRKGPSGDRFHIVFPCVFLLVTRKGTLEEEACILSSQELTGVLLRIQMQSWSVTVLMESPRFPTCLPSLPSSLSWQGAGGSSVNLGLFSSLLACSVLFFRHPFFQIQYLFSVPLLLPLIFLPPVFSLCLLLSPFLPSLSSTSSKAKNKRNNYKPDS